MDFICSKKKENSNQKPMQKMGIVSKELIKKGIYPNIADTSRESVNRMSQMAKM